jgi:hypothetical protein
MKTFGEFINWASPLFAMTCAFVFLHILRVVGAVD